MQLVRPTEIVAYHEADFVAVPNHSGNPSNVRMIRPSPGQALPPHTHGTSDLFLYVAEGAGELDTPNGPVPLVAGDLAQYRGDEELRVASTAEEGMTLLAFLAPEFPRPDAP